MAFTPVQEVGSLTDNSDTVIVSNAIIAKTGVFRFVNAGTRTCRVSANGNPNAGTDAVHAHIPAGAAEQIKFSSTRPKNVKVSGISVHASAPAITVAGGSTSGNSSFAVGDYVTLVGAAVTGYNTAIAHVPITAINNVTGAITVTANTSALAAFTGTAQLYHSIKVSAVGDTTNGLNVHVAEVQLLG